jgi:hypothetical protein
VFILPAALSSRSQSLGRRIFIAEAARPQPPGGLRNVRFCPLFLDIAQSLVRDEPISGRVSCRPLVRSSSNEEPEERFRLLGLGPEDHVLEPVDRPAVSASRDALRQEAGTSVRRRAG